MNRLNKLILEVLKMRNVLNIIDAIFKGMFGYYMNSEKTF